MGRTAEVVRFHRRSRRVVELVLYQEANHALGLDQLPGKGRFVRERLEISIALLLSLECG